MTITIPDKIYFGNENYYCSSSEIRDGKLYIQVKSHKHPQKCPSCGQESSYVHKRKPRILQDVPIHGLQTFLEVEICQYVCLNKECKRKYFNEDLPFARRRGTRTIFLDEMVLAFAMFMSNEGASKILKLLNVQISNDAIASLYDKLIFEEIEIEEIGIDDVALRRGQKYGTVIYDSATHQLIALLEGRKKEDVVDWLRDHQEIKKVMRDRGSNYIQAIKEALPDCVEVADRFHILQNLIDMLTDILNEDLPNEIYIQDGKILKKKPKMKKRVITPTKEERKSLDSLDIDDSAPVDEKGNIIVFNDHNSEDYGKVVQQFKENRLKKQTLIRDLQDFYRKHPKITFKDLAKRFRITPPTAKKICKYVRRRHFCS